jgi:hypothetical protein
LAESVGPNALNRRGIPTKLELDPTTPTVINYVMAVVAIPSGFDQVSAVQAGEGGVELVAANGRKAKCAMDLDFLGLESGA